MIVASVPLPCLGIFHTGITQYVRLPWDLAEISLDLLGIPGPPEESSKISSSKELPQNLFTA
jgi:hypothetical protein